MLLILLPIVIASPPFKISLCGANKKPTPYPIKEEDCSRYIMHPEPIVQGTLNLITRGDTAVPVDAYRCHKVITYTSCMEWFLGVKDIKSWVEGAIVSREECLSVERGLHKQAAIQVKYPKANCIWWGNNTLHEETILFEPTTIFVDVLTDHIHAPGVPRNSTINDQWIFSGVDWIYIPQLSISHYRIASKLAHHSVSCQRSSHRITCPSEGITFWAEDLLPLNIFNKSLYKISHGLYILNDTNSIKFLPHAPKSHPKKGNPAIQYLLTLISDLKHDQVSHKAYTRCSINNLRRNMALAVSSISPSLAAFVYFGRPSPGTIITSGGLVKYPCLIINQWEFNTLITGYRDVPIDYWIPSSPIKHTGYLDPFSLSIKESSVRGVPPGYLTINQTHVYDLHAYQFLDPFYTEIIHKVSTFPIRGVASFKEDELDAMSSVLRLTEWIIKTKQDEGTRYEPNSHIIYALKDTPALDVIRQSKSWFASFLGSGLSMVLEIGGSLVLASLTIFIAIKVSLHLLSSIKPRCKPHAPTAPTTIPLSSLPQIP